MSDNIILMPLFAQMLLTFIVWLVMYKTRIGEMEAKKIHPQKLADATEAKALLKDSSKAANNFINLFEIPILFYILTIVIYITQTTDKLLLGLLTVFVISRYIHSYIQITNNKVMTRFKIYAIGAALLWIGWVVLAIKLFG